MKVKIGTIINRDRLKWHISNPDHAPTCSKAIALVDYNLVNPGNVFRISTGMFWARFIEQTWTCSLAFRWHTVPIALLPAWLPRNWHLGNERPIADGGTWLCWGWESGAKREGNGNQHEGGSSGWAMADIKHIGGRCRMSDDENDYGSDRSASATTDLNDDVFYVHQYHQRGLDEAYKRARENVVIADNGQTGMRINLTF